MRSSILLAIALKALLLTNTSFASDTPLFYGKSDSLPRTRDLNWLNEQHLDKQRKRVEALTRRHFGQQLKNGKLNLRLLQRLLDEQRVDPKDKEELQALGVVLGDIYVSTDNNLVWRVYEDELGSSHAVCVNDSLNCLFPVTMLSRRIEAGAKPSVQRVYKKGETDIKEFLPKLPFSD